MDLCLTLTEIQWSLTKDVASVVGSVASLGAVIAAVVFGCLGLKTWKQQMRGTANHEMSRKLLVAIYSFQATLNSARDIGLSVDELGEGDAYRISQLGDDSKRFAFTYAIYRARLQKIETSLAPVRAYLMEARALWGDGLEDVVNDLIAMKDEWWTVARRYSSAMNPAEDSETRERYARAWIEHKGVLYDDDQNNEFGRRITQRLSKIEAYLRTKM